MKQESVSDLVTGTGRVTVRAIAAHCKDSAGANGFFSAIEDETGGRFFRHTLARSVSTSNKATES